MSINDYAARTGRILKEDGTVINEADIIAPVTTIHQLAGTASIGNGWAAITTGKSSLSLSIKATPGTTYTVNFFCGLSGVSHSPIYGYCQTTNNSGTSSTVSNAPVNNMELNAYEEIWVFNFPGSSEFYAQLSAISGGSVTIVSNAILGG